MNFFSTRNKQNKVSPSYAIAHGLAADGGLFVPESFPALTADEIKGMADSSYAERSAYVMSKFLTDFSYEELLSYTQNAYARFDGDPAPVVKTDDNTFVLELWHGPTSAFKDMALTVLPYLITASKAKLGDEKCSLVLVATSGDTGKAAMEGFRDVPGTRMIVFYPDGGVSSMQELQMRTQEGCNIDVVAVKGNFDDCQTAVKTIFNDESAIAELGAMGYELSSANSINWGRLVPQIAYYVSAYVDLMDSGEIEYGAPVNFCVPCGNFGNILAAYYAKRMGLPVGKLICASNKNNVLYDFINTGVYSTKRDFYKTISPSMDILVSSNLERLLFELCNRSDEAVSAKMSSLATNREYRLDDNEFAALRAEFQAYWYDDEQTLDAIEETFDETGYLVDTHTAVAVAAATEAGDDDTPIVVVSTASPYKFTQDVLYALTGQRISDPFKAAKALEMETAMEIPQQISALKSKPILHSTVTEKAGIYGTVRQILVRGKNG